MPPHSRRLKLDDLVSRFPAPVTRWGRRLGLSALVGLLGGLAAAGLDFLIHHGSEMLVGRFTHLGGAEILHFQPGVLLLPAAGGLFSGLVVFVIARQKAGHGTDILTRAFHHQMGELKLLGPAVKAGAAGVVISCGGSAGPEGPIGALGAALGSTIGRLFRVTPHERRVLLVAGCAAGVGSIFRCPLGGALFATGVLYSDPEFESDAIVPSVIASVTGYSLYMTFMGFGEPMLQGVSTLRFSSAIELVPYLLLGPICGLAGIMFFTCLHTVEDHLLPLSRLPRWLAPAAGGLATGALACLLPQIMDGRYIFIQNALDGSIFPPLDQINWWHWTALFAGVVVLKIVATSFTVGSGASGGVLGPSVFIGGVTGAFVGALCESIFPGTFPEPLRRALIPVGMAGVLAAAMRTPLAAIVMVTEMTGSYGLIVPLMLVCITSYIIGRPWGLNRQQVRTAADSPAHAADTVIHVLESWRVGQFMDRRIPAPTPPDSPLRELVAQALPGTSPVFVVMHGHHVQGLISPAEIKRLADAPGLEDVLIAADVMTPPPPPIFDDDDLYRALNHFQQLGVDALPVHSRERHRPCIGMIHRQEVLDALQKYLSSTQQTLLREHSGLSAIDRDQQVQQIMTAVTPMHQNLIQKLLVPIQVVGMSLRQADLRKRFGVHVIAIEQADGSLQCPPDIDTPLNTSQRLLAVVSQEGAKEALTDEAAR